QFWLFLAAILVYLLVRLIGLDKFPIYFFSDEAIQTVWAVDFIKHGFQGENGELLPAFFPNAGQYNLSISVYLQVIPYLLFGSSVFINRLVSVLVTLIAAISVGLTAKNIFNSRYPWLSILLLSLTPIWFLHSRTSFETVMSTAFYAGLIYFYLMYRYKSPHYMYGTVIMAALCFYTYSPAQVVIVFSVIFLFLSDIRYHWKNRKTVFGALILGLLLLIPYFRFLVLHGEENANHLEILGSYIVMNNLSLFDKAGIYFNEYIHSLNPLYWFLPNEEDIVRHIMKGYGHLLVWTIPFAVLGFFQVFKNVKQSSYRTLLILLLVIPSGASLVGRGPTRLLFIVIPMVLISSIGAETFLNWLQKKRFSYLVLTVSTYAILIFGNVYILSDALLNGPTWFTNYGLGGMQYGGEQVTTEIKDILAKDPNTHIVLSHTWANGTDTIMRFFMGDPLPIKLDSVDGFAFDHHEIKPNTIFIFTPQEFEDIQNSPKFQDIKVEKILPYPDGSAGFIFFRMRYADQIDKIMAEEIALRHQLSTETVSLGDLGNVKVSYSKLDMGNITDIFDHEPTTLIRTAASNPLTLKFEFQRAVPLKGVDVLTGSAATRYSARVWLDGESEPRVFQIEEKAALDNHLMKIDFGNELSVSKLELDIHNYEENEPAHVHLWDVTFEK
ncbi:MAG: glycosyltransferase family 39 protein, partial [Anaerolineae bacterium]|nr:glycosyltransferase family 39 protein [Anaerolineae bacterium]